MYNHNKEGSNRIHSSSLSFRPPVQQQQHEQHQHQSNKENETLVSTIIPEQPYSKSLLHSSLPTSTSRSLHEPLSENRKRVRDIRGIDRFREVVYGETGFRRLHAMVCRDPVLMYPSTGIAEARSRVQNAINMAKTIWREKIRKSRASKDAQQILQLQEAEGQQYQNCEEEELQFLEYEEEEEELSMMTDSELLEIFAQHEKTKNRYAAKEDVATAKPFPQPQESKHLISGDVELSKYHHKQLDALIRLVYEFNQATFTKLPLNDTMQMLSRCGKESVGHLMEYETHVRLAHEKRVKEMKSLHDEEEILRRRTLDVELQRAEMELAKAEEIEEQPLSSINTFDGMQTEDNLLSSNDEVSQISSNVINTSNIE